MKPLHALIFAGAVVIAAVVLLARPGSDSAVERAADSLAKQRAGEAAAAPQATPTPPPVELAEPDLAPAEPMLDEIPPEAPLSTAPEFAGDAAPLEPLPPEAMGDAVE